MPTFLGSAGDVQQKKQIEGPKAACSCFQKCSGFGVQGSGFLVFGVVGAGFSEFGGSKVQCVKESKTGGTRTPKAKV